jgi:hypothetical protein
MSAKDYEIQRKGVKSGTPSAKWSELFRAAAGLQHDGRGRNFSQKIRVVTGEYAGRLSDATS